MIVRWVECKKARPASLMTLKGVFGKKVSMNGKKARQRHNDVECTQFHVLCERFVKIFDGFARTQQVELATKKTMIIPFKLL